MNGGKLGSMYTCSERFHREFIKYFNPKIDTYVFPKLRIYYLNKFYKIVEQYKANINSVSSLNMKLQEKKYTFINIIHIAFNIWANINRKEKNKNEIFDIFFNACLLYLSPFIRYNTNKLIYLNKHISGKYYYSLRALRLIKVVSQGNELFLPCHLIELILANKNEELEFVYDLIDFCICEFEIFKKFNLFFITLSCIYLCKNEDINKRVKKIIYSFNKRLKLKFFNCVSLIKNKLEN